MRGETGAEAAAAGKRRPRGTIGEAELAAAPCPLPVLAGHCHVPSGHTGASPGTAPGARTSIRHPGGIPNPSCAQGSGTCGGSDGRRPREGWGSSGTPGLGKGRGRLAGRDLYRRTPVLSLAPAGASRLAATPSAPPTSAQSNQRLASP